MGVNGGGVIDVSVVLGGISEGVLGSDDSAAGLDESPVAQTGCAEGPFLDAAAANALWALDANAPKPDAVVGC